MNEQHLEHLLSKMQEVYESGKPLQQDIQARWQQHQGLLSMTNFILSLSSPSPTQESLRIRQEMIEQFAQLSVDFQQVLTLLTQYQGLTRAMMGIQQEYQETDEQY